MPPLTKDPVDSLPAATPTRLRTVAVAEDAARPQPVCIEVPITVQGVRAATPGEKREPFTETTRTVIVFANGGVVRLAAPVNHGQPLFLTNERTQKEIVCQVVKSKTYASVPGYVELEFTEPNVGFWGMRFPSDNRRPEPVSAPTERRAEEPQPVPLPATPVAVIEEISAAPVRTLAPPVAAPLQSMPSVAELQPAASLPAPRVEQPQPAPPPPPAAPAGAPDELPALPTTSVAPPVAAPPQSTPGAPEPHPVAPYAAQHVEQAQPVPPVVRPSAVPEELLVALARPVAPPATALPLNTPNMPQPADTSAHEAPAAAPVPSRPLPIPPWPEVPTPRHEERREERVRAADTSVPHVPPAPPAPPVTPRGSASAHVEPLVFTPRTRPSPPPLSPSETPAGRQQTPVFTSSLLEKKGKPQSRSAVTGLIAAGVLFGVVGGGWYWWQHSNRSASAQPASSALLASKRTAPVVATAPSPVSPGPGSPAAAAASVPPSSRSSIPASGSPSAKSDKPGKKSAPQRFRLSTPVASRPTSVRDSSAALDAAPDVSSNAPSAAPGGLISGQDAPKAISRPAAPLGGQTIPPKRFSTTPPVYPSLARMQHIQGDVTLDVLVDANGRPSTTKVLSGPALLQQAAVSAVRQWKYQPGMLNGAAIPTHVSVTITFRLD